MPAMAGYVAMARVERGRVRTLAWEAPAALDGVVPEEAADRPTVQPDDGVTLAEELERLRDQLRMVTFYLTDPASWR
jgi:hypothetical protein